MSGDGDVLTALQGIDDLVTDLLSEDLVDLPIKLMEAVPSPIIRNLDAAVACFLQGHR